MLRSSRYPCLVRGSSQGLALVQKLKLFGRFSSSDYFSHFLVAESGAVSWKGDLLDWTRVLQQTRGVSSTGLTGREVLAEECINLELGRHQ